MRMAFRFIKSIDRVWVGHSREGMFWGVSAEVVSGRFGGLFRLHKGRDLLIWSGGPGRQGGQPRFGHGPGAVVTVVVSRVSQIS